jgi:hypothetical protein
MQTTNEQITGKLGKDSLVARLAAAGSVPETVIVEDKPYAEVSDAAASRCITIVGSFCRFDAS